MTDVKRIGIIGLGMIGASLAAALSGAGYETFGFDVDENATRIARERGYIKAEIGEISALDALVVALNEGATIGALEKYAPALKKGAVMFDVCGNKRGVVARMEELKRVRGDLKIVSTHPMAGRETDGKAAGILKASPKLFEGAYVVVVPIEGDVEAVEAVKRLYLAAGARGIKIADATTHDSMISYTSQLAHILSSSYAKSDKARAHRGFSAGSFADLTRVARLDPRMWTELFLNNRDMLIADIEALEAQLELYREALEDGDGRRLEELLEEGNAYKDAADKNMRAHKEDL